MRTAEELRQKRAELLAEIARVEAECELNVFKHIELTLNERIEEYFRRPNTLKSIQHDFTLTDHEDRFKGINFCVVSRALASIGTHFSRGGFRVTHRFHPGGKYSSESFSVILAFDQEEEDLEV